MKRTLFGTVVLVLALFGLSAFAAGPTVIVSNLTGAHLPLPAEPVTDKASIADMAGDIPGAAETMGTRCAATEMLLWSGAGYSRDRADTIILGIAAELEKMGHAWEVVERTEKGGTAVSVFRARSAGRLIGGSFAANDRFLLLTWCDLKEGGGETKASKAAKAAATAKPRPGWVTGSTVDAFGNPLPSAEVAVVGFTATGEQAHLRVRPDAAGHYAIQAPQGYYRVFAVAPYTFLGRTYRLCLHPYDDSPTHAPSALGIATDFSLRLTGIKPGRFADSGDADSYYGGIIWVSAEDPHGPWNQITMPPGGTLTITLTPEGPLVDGSAGASLTFAKTLPTNMLYGWRLADVPVGVYRAEASLTTPKGETLPLRVASDCDPAKTVGASATLCFVPKTGGDWGSACGVVPARLYVLP